ncbi:hypothetical protein BXZ73DRAFT_111047, partial [Epithele typhae]
MAGSKTGSPAPSALKKRKSTAPSAPKELKKQKSEDGSARPRETPETKETESPTGDAGVEDDEEKSESESEIEVEVKEEGLTVEESLFKIAGKHTGDGEAVDIATRDFEEIGRCVNGHNAMLVLRSALADCDTVTRMLRETEDAFQKGQPMPAARKTFTSPTRAEGEAPYAVIFTADRNSGPLLPQLKPVPLVVNEIHGGIFGNIRAFWPPPLIDLIGAPCPGVVTAAASTMYRVKDVWFEGVVDDCLKELIGVLGPDYTVGIARDWDSETNAWSKHAIVRVLGPSLPKQDIRLGARWYRVFRRCAYCWTDNEKGSAHSHVECPRFKAENKTRGDWELQPLAWTGGFLSRVDKPVEKPIEVRVE